MKILIIDNYDSFTYNIYHDLAAITGVEPIVVRNDQATWHELSKQKFEAIVISPGPGRPDRTSDFGICWDVLTSAQVPVLGVCLGHQGLAVFEGGKVDNAAEPMHGRPSQVYHNGDALFTGVPSPFSAVRYHSLIVDPDLPENLELVAWTDNGQVMAIRHRSLPRWGVQFHPESICTEYGRQILENFVQQCRQWKGRESQALVVERNELRCSPCQLQLQWRKLHISVEPEVVFANLFADSDNAFWLDSGAVIPGYSRFSFMGDDRGPLARVLEWQGLEAFAELDRELQSQFVPYDDRLPFAFQGGWVGHFNYELHEVTSLLSDSATNARWLFADRVLVWDHGESAFYLIQLVSEPQIAEQWFEAMEKSLNELAGHRLSPVPRLEASSEPIFRADREKYLYEIQHCQELIRQGESYEICLTNQVEFNSQACAFDVYRRLRTHNPAPYAAYLQWKDFQVLSSSPERFLRIEPSGLMEAKPIKGTAARRSTEAEDERQRLQLCSSEKERAENLMIVDLLRNDLGSVAEVNSVHVPHLMQVESYATVHQLVSTVRAQLRRDVRPLEAVRAAFPGGSMTGAPKHRTLEIIRAIEERPRGVYSGALGFLAANGAVDLSIVIRTLVAQNGRYRMGAGGAITALSDPEAEWDEMLLKLIGRNIFFRD